LGSKEEGKANMNMRLISKWLGAMAVMAAGVFSAQGEVLLGWNVLGLTGTPNATTTTVKHVSLQDGVLTRGPGLGAASGTDGFFRQQLDAAVQFDH
jgi:hypothetical protein